jgi:16S rRNA (cytosine1402-N4)-methyltransferase
MKYRHTPVMVEEVLDYLNCRPGHVCIDCTVGGAGHAAAILERILPGGLLVAIDQDADAIAAAEAALTSYPSNVHLVHDNFVNLSHILEQLHISSVDAILADLGVSLHQLAESGRGFSFQKEEPLDMRMDHENPETAGDIVNSAPAATLERIFRTYGEERWAARIAREIVRRREEHRVETTGELVAAIQSAIPKAAIRKQKIHPATRVFMALRIAVNQELERLDQFLTTAVESLQPGGRICILSFHSLEDRMVKHRFKALADPCTCPPDFPACVCGRQPKLKILTRKVRRPSAAEVEQNPMARSTCLRAAERL